MAAAPFRVIRARPFLRPPLTRYKRGGYLCPEWYHRARSTPVPCMGIQSTGSSTPLDQAVSFILRPRMRWPRPEFLIIRRTFTKVSKPLSSTMSSRDIRKIAEAAFAPFLNNGHFIEIDRRRFEVRIWHVAPTRRSVPLFVCPFLPDYVFSDKFGEQVVEKLSIHIALASALENLIWGLLVDHSGLLEISSMKLTR